jgi:hypothetical protein
VIVAKSGRKPVLITGSTDEMTIADYSLGMVNNF